MRRRLWLVIIQLDSRAAELSGSGLSIITQPWDTKPPLNVNDCDLYPDMQEPPTEQVRATEMMFVLLRAQIGVFLTKEKPAMETFDGVFSRFSDSTVLMAEKKREIDELEQVLEEKIVRYCDPQIPLHQFTSVLAKAAICKMRLFAHLPRLAGSSYSSTARASASTQTASPTAEETLLFDNSLQILKYHIQIRTSASLHRFLWHTHFQWQALIYLLAHLRAHPRPAPRTEAVWATIDELFTSHPELIRGDRTKTKLSNAVSLLTLKAWEAWEEGSRLSNGAVYPPSCIARLCEQSLRGTTTIASSVRSHATPEAAALAVTAIPPRGSQTPRAHTRNSPDKGGKPQDQSLNTFNPTFPLDVTSGYPSAVTNPIPNPSHIDTTTTTDELSWIDTNPMDWENWNSIYEDSEMQEQQWGNVFGSLAPFPEF